jgi:GNAT superfamily N-acetyltransferase
VDIAVVTEGDLPDFMELITEYAEFMAKSGVGAGFVNTLESVRQALFSVPPRLEAIVARRQGRPAGLVCWSETYHLMNGRITMAAKHLYLRREHRGGLLAMLLLTYLLNLAVERGYWRVEGVVDTWNKPVYDLYMTFKARKLDDIIFRFEDLGQLPWYKGHAD